MVGLCMCGVSSVHLTTNKSDSKKEEALSFSHKPKDYKQVQKMNNQS